MKCIWKLTLTNLKEEQEETEKKHKDRENLEKLTPGCEMEKKDVLENFAPQTRTQKIQRQYDSFKKTK